ncbi:MAG: hypothetical protein ACYC4S_00120 [Rhodoferax sp.]
MMFILETQKAHSEMRLTFAIIITALALGALSLWAFKATGWASTGVIVGVVLGIIVIAGIVGTWIRHRQRRRLMDMQDSALW